MKARAGVDWLFVWRAPKPVTVAPTCTVRLPTGDKTPALSVVHAQVAISGISDDRRTLTATGAVADAAGLQGQWGAAYLVTSEDTYHPVRVARIDGAAVTLAEPLKRTVAITANASLIFATWTATFSAAEITGAQVRNVAVQVAWAPAVGADVPSGGQTWRRLLDVVAQPFDTNLDHAELVRAVPALARYGSDRQEGFDEQIAASLERLALLVRKAVPDGYSEDDVDGARLLQVHTQLAAAAVYAGNGDTTQAEWHLAQALGERNPSTLRREPDDGLLHLALSKILVDLDQDGVPETGEIQNLAGPAPATLGNFATSDGPTFDTGDAW